MKTIWWMCVALLFVSSPLCSYSHAQPEKEAVTLDFAIKLSDWYRNGGDTGFQQAMEALDALSRIELRELKKLIDDDVTSQAGVIVTPALPVEYRVIHGLSRHIDDRLGILINRASG